MKKLVAQAREPVGAHVTILSTLASLRLMIQEAIMTDWLKRAKLEISQNINLSTAIMPK